MGSDSVYQSCRSKDAESSIGTWMFAWSNLRKSCTLQIMSVTVQYASLCPLSWRQMLYPDASMTPAHDTG